MAAGDSHSISCTTQLRTPKHTLEVIQVQILLKVKMGDKKKAGAMLVRLVSAAGTGFFYVVKKTKRLQSSNIKLEFRKYDPRVRRHVLFTEAKMK
ncbi:hypothetical protein ABFS83_14G012600 [Erythranthe nasuta]